MAELTDQTSTLEWAEVSELSKAAIDKAATLLDEQWPTTSGISGRARQLLRSRAELPASFVATRGKSVVGHVCLRAASEVADGRSAIVYSVVVSPSNRRQGLGRFVMSNVEAEARSRGFSYLYLFTDDQQPFYESCGYSVCERISAVGQVAVKFLNASSLDGLQRMVAARAARQQKEEDGEIVDASTGGSETVAGANAIWLRKALVETTPSTDTDRAVDAEMLAGAADECWGPRSGLSWRLHVQDLLILRGATGANLAPFGLCGDGCEVALLDASWERQVGPSCGLALIRVLSRFLHARGASRREDAAEVPGKTEAGVAGIGIYHPTSPLPPQGSILSAAKERGYSNEGEMFSLENMVRVCASKIARRGGSQL